MKQTTMLLVAAALAWCAAGCGDSGTAVQTDAGSTSDAPVDAAVEDAAPQEDAPEQIDAPPLDGPPPVVVTDIRALQQDPSFSGGLIPVGTRIRLEGAVVTASAPTASVFFVQNASGPKEYSGIIVRKDAYLGTLPTQGDVVTALEATLVEETRSCNADAGTCPTRHSLRYPGLISFVTGGTVPDPLAIPTAGVLSDPAQVDGVLLSLTDADLQVTGPATGSGSHMLIPINNAMAVYGTYYAPPGQPPVGTPISTAIGVLDVYNRTWEIYPRSVTDLIFDGWPPDGGITDAGPTDSGVTDAGIVGDAAPCSGSVVISQIYGGGGNTGAVYNADFIELFNRGDTAVDLGTWSVQYASSQGTSWTRIDLNGFVIPAGGYLLIRGATGIYGGSLPTPDIIATTNLSAVNGKLALVANQTTLSGSCPLAAVGLVDFVGYGDANCAEGGLAAPDGGTSNILAVTRLGEGCTDFNNNAYDFIAQTPVPRTSLSGTHDCGCVTPQMDAGQSDVLQSDVLQSDVLQSDASLVGDAAPCSGSVVISQVYGGGGNQDAVYTHDFIELFNRGDTTVDLNAWSVQYASSQGTSWSHIDLTGLSIGAGGYLLIQGYSGGATGSALPPPDLTASTNLAADHGKVALVSNQTTLSGSCPVGTGGVVDFVGYGGDTDCSEGGMTAPYGAADLAVIRLGDGCTDFNNNGFDFEAGTPTPRNSDSTPVDCGCVTPQQDAGQSDVLQSDVLQSDAQSDAQQDAGPCGGIIVISQVYGGGGNSGAPYSADFVELFNRGGDTVSVDGWSVQYESASGTAWTDRVDLNGLSIPAGGYLLVQVSTVGANGAALPTPDATAAAPFSMARDNGKVALVSSQTTLPAVACPIGDPSVVDFVGYGSADCFEGTGGTPVLNNQNAALRAGDGCTDTDDNSSDFTASTPTPRNSGDPTNFCGCS